MGTRLTDSELAARTREANRRRGGRYRERQIVAGKAGLTVWIPDELRTALAQSAADLGQTMAETATQWLATAAATLAVPKPLATPPPALELNPTITKAERDRLILELHRQGWSNPKIGERFNTSEGSIRRALKRMKELEAAI